MYTVAATWYVQNDWKKAEAGLKKFAEGVRSEPGGLMFLVHEVRPGSLPPAPAGTVVFVEVWKDEAAFEAHLHGKAFTEFLANYGDLFVADEHGNPYIERMLLRRLAGFVNEPAATAD